MRGFDPIFFFSFGDIYEEYDGNPSLIFLNFSYKYGKRKVVHLSGPDI